MIEAALVMLESCEQRNELSEFYEHNKNRFFSIARFHLKNLDDAEDAVQETFLRIADNPRKFFEMSSRERVRFVEGIVRHVSIDKYNKNRKNAAIPIENIDSRLTCCGISPEEKYITDLSAEELVQFTLTLPEKQRLALFMYVHQKLSYSEISKILGISEELARKRVSNARKAIKDFVERINKNE